MQFLEQEILEITETTWQSLLGFELQIRQTSSVPQFTQRSFVGSVGISGSWNGLVMLEGSEMLTKLAAGAIFGKNPDTVSQDDQHHTIYELTNIIAGNIKSLLPRPCQLSLPVVQSCVTKSHPPSGLARVSALRFTCQDQPMAVTVWQVS
ncbi:MAG: hypothetical protein NPIRA05_02180 [Nitrospirales bacterium]|nr:MAG: hypothetical protein NPIRA05_02180 [Nitrospirales bacterium]